MANDEWIEKLHANRKAAADRDQVEKRAAIERRRNFEARVDGLWAEVAAEFGRVLKIYNAGTEERYRVAFEPSREQIWVTTGAAALGVSLSTAREEVSIERVTMTRESGRQVAHSSRRIVQVASGALAIESSMVEHFVGSLLSDFLGSIG